MNYERELMVARYRIHRHIHHNGEDHKYLLAKEVNEVLLRISGLCTYYAKSAAQARRQWMARNR